MASQDTLPGGLPNDEFTPDLEPAAASNALMGEPGLSAADVKELYEKLPDLSKADLRRIPIVPEGARLEPGAQYLDLADRMRGAFTATGEETVAFDQYMVAKARVDYLLWNRLTGVRDPARLDQPDG